MSLLAPPYVYRAAIAPYADSCRDSIRDMELPPVVSLILGETLEDVSGPEELSARLKPELWAELRRQAEWSVSHFDYGVVPPGAGFVSTPIATLNPVSQFPHRPDQENVDKATSLFARTAALYSDITIIADPFTHLFVPGHMHTYELMFAHIRTLNQLAPFLRAGVVQFAGPVGGALMKLPADVEARVQSSARVMVEQQADQLETYLHYYDGQPALMIRGLPMEQYGWFTPHWLSREDLEALPPEAMTREIVKLGEKSEVVRRMAARRFSSFLVAIAREVGLTTAIGSIPTIGFASDLQLLSRIGQPDPNNGGAQDLTDINSVNLPWVSALTADELLRLRERADRSLPRLRVLIAEKLRSSSSNEADISAELRAQAVEVEQEFRRLASSRDNLYRVGIEALALALFAYGISTEVPSIIASTVGAFLATMVHARAVANESAAKTKELAGHPAFALVQAKQLLLSRNTA